MVNASIFRVSSQLTRIIHWRCNCTDHVNVAIHFCDNIWSVSVEAILFYSFVCTCISIAIEDIIIKSEIGTLLFGSTPPHLCTCLKPGLGFPVSYVVVYFCVQWVEVRGDCSLCWYWWKNATRTHLLLSTNFQIHHWTTDRLIIKDTQPYFVLKKPEINHHQWRTKLQWLSV